MCFVWWRSLRRADHSSRGVLPSVCGVSMCDRELSITRRLWPTRACCAIWGGGLNDGTIHSKEQIAWKQIKIIANMDFSPHTHTHLNNVHINLPSTL